MIERLSLRARLVSLVGLVLVVGLGAGLTLTGLQARATLRSELAAAMAGGRQTVDSAYEDLPRSDHADRDLRQLVATFDGNRHVRAHVFDEARGQVLAESRAERAAPAPAWFRRLFSRPPGPIAMPAPAGISRTLVLTAAPAVDIGDLWKETRLILGVLIAAVLGALIAVYAALGAALAPLRGLSEGLAMIGAGDYGARVAVKGPPELASLQRGFNDMGARLAEVSARNHQLEKQLLTLQDEERADLARDLHDDAAPHLFAIGAGAQVLARLAATGDDAAIADQTRAIQQSVTHMQELVRDMLGRLRPSRATELGLAAALDDLAAFWKARAGLELTVALPADDDVPDGPVRETTYRVIQEAVSNAVRHGGATRVEARITIMEGAIQVEVDDDGSGTAPISTDGFGLAGMRERVRALDGEIQIGPTGRLRGWTITVLLPLAHEGPAA